MARSKTSDVDPMTCSPGKLKKAYSGMRESRDAMRVQNERLKKQNAHLQMRTGRLMQETGLVVRALAERCGLAGNPEIEKLATLLGESSYSQWQDGTITEDDIPRLPFDFEAIAETGESLPSGTETSGDGAPGTADGGADAGDSHRADVGDPHRGDAEMEATARIHAAMNALGLSDIARADPDLRDRILELRAAVHDGFDRALARDLPALSDAARDRAASRVAAAPEAMDPVRADAAQGAAYEIFDALSDLQMGQEILRADLRAGMYRVAMTRIAGIANELDDRIQTDRARHPQPDRPRDDGEAPF